MAKTREDQAQETLRPGGLERLDHKPQPVRKHALAGSRSSSKNKRLTLLKRLERNISALFKLGRTEQRAKAAEQDIKRLQEELHTARGDLQGKLKALQEHLSRTIANQTETTSKVIEGRSAEIHRMTADLSRRLDLVARLSPERSDLAAQSSSELPAGLQAFLDSFYHNLENRYRGSTSDIGRRMSIYRPDVEGAALRCQGKPILDLGCGRGEWLFLLKTWGLDASGVDLNNMQIEQAQADGLDVQQGDFKTVLQTLPDESLSAVTAHHLIEHLPFPLVAWLVREAMRVLAPGGLLLLETPDVRNVLVGATSFHNDPTHLQPRTAAVMGVLLETAGYSPVETRRLHPHERLDEFLDKPNVDPEIGYLLFGAQDLAIIGHKPLRTAQ